MATELFHIPDEVLQELGVDVGDSLFLIEEYVGTARCFVLRGCAEFCVTGVGVTAAAAGLRS